MGWVDVWGGEGGVMSVEPVCGTAVRCWSVMPQFVDDDSHMRRVRVRRVAEGCSRGG